jgi:CheY-like chemotaxis protein
VENEVTDETTAPTVLVVDDEPDVRLMVSLSLQRDDRFAVVGEAADGAEAIELAGAHQPDVVLLDLMMPGVDGWEALPRILTQAPRSMVVVLSALDATEHARGSFAAGAFAYLEKQLASRRLADHLDELLRAFRDGLEGRTVIAPSVADPRYRPPS